MPKHSPRPLAQNFHVRDDLARQTLAAAMRHWLPGKSWKEIERLIRARHVQINGNLCVDGGRRLKAAEVVKVLAHSAAPPPREQDVRIVYRDEHVVVVEKPSGITSNRHASEREWPTRRKQLQATLDEMLPRILARLEHGKPKGNPNRPTREAQASAGRRRRIRPVHRLDRDTSGLMVFARSAPAETGLGKQFKAHTIDRCYLAVAQGRIARPRTIESYLVADRGDGRRGSTPDRQRGKHAVTHIKPLEDLGDYTLVECRLETGRTHQIRIHLSEAGHALCGEKVYQLKTSKKGAPDSSGAPRIALHAFELGFTHPVSGKRLHFQMPLPPDLDEFIQRLRQDKKQRPPENPPPAEPSI